MGNAGLRTTVTFGPVPRSPAQPHLRTTRVASAADFTSPQAFGTPSKKRHGPYFNAFALLCVGGGGGVFERGVPHKPCAAVGF